MILLAALAFVLFLLLALHPFITYPLSLIWLRRRRGGAGARHGAFDRTYDPSFSVCMCAYNEERVIEAKCRNLLALRAGRRDLQILVYVDAATDRTEAILRQFAPAITILSSSQRLGKTHGMNRLVEAATGDIVIFTDADVMLQPDIPDRLVRYFADPRTGCVCGHLRHTNHDQSATAATGSVYWRLEERIKQLESDIGSVMGADGSLFAIRRSLHHPPPDQIIDDMYVSLTILLDGYRVVRAGDVFATDEAAESLADEFRRKVRIACQAFTVHRLLWPRLRRTGWLTVYMYVSHKLLRWFGIYSLALAGLALLGLFAAAGRPGLGLLLAGLAAAGLVCGNRLGLQPIPKLVSILVALAGAGLGVWRSLRGDRFQTWPSTSSLRAARSAAPTRAPAASGRNR
jgi:cellulose synthase/poly-beta-1,6-N-acetylglucosamine synthase-like glycosyltransferase